MRLIRSLAVSSAAVTPAANRTHWICEGQGTTRHIHSLLATYLLTNLPAGGR